jgi:hypothetical protein
MDGALKKIDKLLPFRYAYRQTCILGAPRGKFSITQESFCKNLKRPRQPIKAMQYILHQQKYWQHFLSQA